MVATNTSETEMMLGDTLLASLAGWLISQKVTLALLLPACITGSNVSIKGIDKDDQYEVLLFFSVYSSGKVKFVVFFCFVFKHGLL